MLAKSIEDFGAGRSILVDKNGVVIAGNKTREQMVAAGITDAIVVETDGTKPVVVKRTDLDLSESKGKARQLAYLDNRVAEVDLDWDRDVIEDDIKEGLDISAGFTESEIAMLTLQTEHGETDANEEWQGMPEFEQPDASGVRSIIVHFKTEQDVAAFARLTAQNISDKTKFIWFPYEKQESAVDKRYLDGSSAPEKAKPSSFTTAAKERLANLPPDHVLMDDDEDFEDEDEDELE